MSDGRELPPAPVDPDIRRASTLASAVYTDPTAWERMKDRVFARTWQLVADTHAVRTPRRVHPLTLLEGCLDEPLVLTRDDADRLHCLSNVCTHRGNLVAESPGHEPCLTCRYHGRRFELDGRLRSMPEFEGVEGFPSEKDDLPRVPHGLWRQFVFAGVDPAFDLDRLVAPMEARVGWMPVEEARLDPSRSKDYLVHANWALYCDNYLEGFHIPFVHPGLGAALDYGAYRTELFDLCNVQIGVSKGGEDTFDVPPGSPDHDPTGATRIAAYYFWLFPNTMFNFYPWGISVNVVRPLGVALTRVSFLTYVWDESRLGAGAGAELDKVEREDESVVECVQRGLRSRFYERGRYSPAREQGVHHFHRLLGAFLDGTPPA